MTAHGRGRQWLFGCAVAAVALSLHSTRASAAPTKDECIDADTHAQDLRRSGKLLSAREALLVCTDEACPKMVREDCTQRRDELASRLPSVVFAVRDGSGRDLSAVVVSLDGKPLVDHLDGSSLEIDPGEHTFDLTSPGLTSVTLKLVIREGERGRYESVFMGQPVAAQSPAPQPLPVADALPATKPQHPAPEPRHQPSTPGGAQRLIGWTALGLGTAGLVLGSAFGLESKSKHDDAKACSATCPDPSSHQANKDALKFGNMATVAFVAGAVGVAGGLTLWLTAKRNAASPRVGLGLGALLLRGGF